MSNKRLVWLAALGLALHLTACTSSDKSSDVVDVGDDIEAATEDPSGGSDDALLSDSLPEESLGDENEMAESAAEPSLETPAEPTDTASLEEAAPAEPPSMVTEPIPTESALEPSATVTDSAPPAAAETQPAEDMSAMTASTEHEQEQVEEKPAPRPSVPLQKMATKPWKVGQTWFNAIYFARPGDTLASVSQSIYGEDKTALLKKGNPTYKSRDLKPGDKVYYNSPRRPDDGETMVTFYEEAGLQPEIYVAKPGDNIRAVSKDLLGFDNAWKEVWSSNLAVESKGAIPEGTELHYWRSVAAAAPPAQANMEAPPEMPAAPDMPPPPDMNAQQAANDLPPPPPPMPDMPPPPPMEAAPPPPPPQAMEPPPPPPPPMEAVPPPPPPPSARAKNQVEEEVTGMDEDTMITLGMVAIGAAAVAALLVVRRRKKAKEMENHLDSTHVG